MEGTLGRTIKGQPVGRRKMEEGAMTEEASSFSILGKAYRFQEFLETQMLKHHLRLVSR